MTDFVNTLSSATADRYLSDAEAEALTTVSAPTTDAEVEQLARTVAQIRSSQASSADGYSVESTAAYRRMTSYLHARRAPSPTPPPPSRTRGEQILRCAAGAAVGSLIGVVVGDLVASSPMPKIFWGVVTGTVAAPLGCYVAMR